jgi:hypothetical protein
MEISRRAPGEASLVMDGRDILDFLQAEGSEEEFEQALDTLADLLRLAGQQPRVVVHYKEGLFAALQADSPIQAVLIEDDPHDEPPLALHRHTVPADPAAVDAALAAAERRLRLAGRAGGA